MNVVRVKNGVASNKGKDFQCSTIKGRSLRRGR